MNKIFFFTLLIISVSTQAQKNIYESPRFDVLSESHETLAILPFLTTLDLKNKVSQKDLKSLEENEGYAVQNAFETYFSKRGKNKNLFKNLQ